MSHRRSIQSFNSFLSEKLSSKSNASSDGASYSEKATATGNAGDLCSACARVPVAEFLTPYEWADSAYSRPKRQFTDETYLISEIAERSGTCTLCRLIAHAIHAGLAMDAGKPLPEPSESTPADIIKAFFPIKPFGPDDFSQCRAWLRQSLNSVSTELPPSKSWFNKKRRYRVVYRIEVHLVDNSLTEAQFKRKSSHTAIGCIQLMMDKAEDEKMLPDLSMKTFHLGRTVPERVRYPQIRKWLNICQGRHPDCTSTQYDKGEYPERMRVIDVNNWQICDAPENAPFVTLSYCWGKDQKHKLLEKDLNVWTKPNGMVALKELPRTIQDAVVLMKRLGWQYLWVDALCIVQNNAEVTMDQIEQMDRIYAHSRFTIVAADGSDCDAGLPGVTTPRRKMQLIATVQGHRVAVKLPDVRDSLKVSVWNTRGWTYQELLLCSATLFFTSHQLYFECFSPELNFEDVYADPTDTWPDPNEPYQSPYDHSSARMAIRAHMDHSWNILAEHPPADRYLISVKNFIKEYTYRSLTNPNDIFDAVLGAYNRLERLSPAWSRGVVAGLPVLGFDQALTWLPLSAPSRRTTSDKTSVPQWTWATNNGPVQLTWMGEFDTKPPLINDIHIHTTTGLRIHLPTPLVDVTDNSQFRNKKCPADREPWGVEGWIAQIRRALPDPDPAAIEKAKQDIITHKRALKGCTQKLEFRSEVATLWIAPRPARREGKEVWSGQFHNNTGEAHEVAPIVTAEGVWAGTLRVPRDVLDEIVKEGEPRRMEFVAVLRAMTKDTVHADETAWLESPDMVRPVPASPEEGESLVVLAVERTQEGLARWAVGTVVKAAWVQAGAKEQVVFMV